MSLILADAIDALADLGDESVDLIYTDPPYPRAMVRPCIDILVRHAPRILKDGGSMVLIVPHYYLAEAIEQLAGSLKYRWVYCMDQENGPHPRMAMGIEVCWKPMLHYVKRAYPSGRGFLRDKVSIPAPEKGFHPWQQAEAWAEYYIQRLCPEDGLVVDPFVGAGTVPVVARRLGRRWIGIDNDPDQIEASKERLYG